MKTNFSKGLNRWLAGRGQRLGLTGLFATLLAFSSPGQSSVKLSWNASTNASVKGYKVYYGVVSQLYTNSVDVGASRAATIGNLRPGTNYFFAVTAYNASNTQSGFSTEVETVTPPAPFFNGQTLVSNTVVGLNFPGGHFFGNFTVISFPWIYHQDLGLVYYTDAKDGRGGIYLKDSVTSTTWYTSPTVWPQLYDGTLKAWLYYYPDPKRAGHYTSAPRMFLNMNTDRNLAK